MRKHPYLCFLLMIAVTLNLYGQGEWTLLNKPTSRSLFKLHFLDSQQGWAAGEQGIILTTPDGGDTWVEQISNIDDSIIDIFMLNENLGWALANFYPEEDDTTYGTIMLKTVNGGDTWEQEVFPEEFFYSVVFFDSLRGWLGGEFGTILGTTDGGSTWFQPVIDPGPGAQFPIHSFEFFSPRYGYAMGGHFDISGVVWKTTNGGQRWTPQVVGPEPYYDMHFKDSLNVMAVGGDFDFGSGMVQTTDGGSTWEYVYLSIFGQARALSFRTETEAWAPLGFTGTYMYSHDGGRTWTDLYTPDSSAIYDLVFADSLTGFAVGAYGTVLKYTSPPVFISPEPAIVPETPVLYENYPNPFNPSTNIGFRLPAGVSQGGISDFPARAGGYVSLEVFDISGRKVVTLVSGNKPPGDYEVKWDGRDEAGSEVSSGLYIYRLRVSPKGQAAIAENTGTFEQSRKMLLIR